MLQTNQDLKAGWGIMDEGDKTKFIEKCQNVMGNQMKKMLERTIVETVCKSKMTEFEAYGPYEEKECFEEKCKDKLITAPL